MLFKNKVMQVEMVDKEPQDGVDMYRPSPRPFINLDPYLVHEVAKHVTVAYASIVTVRTLCGIITHVVVTKVK